DSRCGLFGRCQADQRGVRTLNASQVGGTLGRAPVGPPFPTPFLILGVAPHAAAPLVRFFMVNRNLIREFEVSDEDWNEAIGIGLAEELPPEVLFEGEDVSVDQIVEGTIVRVDDEYVIIDVGYKSEGMVPRDEWKEEGAEGEEEEVEPPKVGDK